MENSAFIGSIFDVLVGIVNIFLVDFIEISIKSIKNYHTGVKISKLGREIIEISIISPVQTHKLPYSARNTLKFRYIPSKVCIKASFHSNVGCHWRNFPNINQVYVFFSFLSIILHINSVGVCYISSSKTHIIK